MFTYQGLLFNAQYICVGVLYEAWTTKECLQPPSFCEYPRCKVFIMAGSYKDMQNATVNPRQAMIGCTLPVSEHLRIKHILFDIITHFPSFCPHIESLKCKQIWSNVIYYKVWKVIRWNIVGRLQNLYTCTSSHLILARLLDWTV